MTKIEWTDRVWNPVTGCTKVSAGCKNCYAERMAKRLKAMGQPRYKNGFRVSMHKDILYLPLRWKKPRMIFVNSMSDLFHEDVPDKFIVKVFETMAKSKQHTFQILTKRPERMVTFFEKLFYMPIIPLSNVWIGVSIENQETADERIPQLLATPAAVHFISAEPLLGQINLRFPQSKNPNQDVWVICGGESGPNARPMHPEWVKSMRDQCQASGVPFFFKQWGEWIGSRVEEETCIDTYLVMQAENGVDYTAPVEGKYADRPDRFKIKQHLWPDGMRSLRVGKKEAGCLLDGVEHKQYPMPKGFEHEHGDDKDGVQKDR
jgi:protein gp37